MGAASGAGGPPGAGRALRGRPTSTTLGAAMPEIVLYQFPGAFGLRTLSPFCTKLEAYLRLAGVPYTAKLGDPRQAPRGKLPYVRWDGGLVGDSQGIVDRLRAEVGDPLDGHLDDRQRALGLALRRTAEDHLYWALLAVRWGDDETWGAHYRAAIGAFLPAAIRPLLVGVLRRGVQRSLRAHGLGRHDRDTVVAQGRADLDAIATVLGDGPYLFGERPTSVDCAVYAQVEHLRHTRGHHPLAVAAREHERLVAWCERMNAAIDWPA